MRDIRHNTAGNWQTCHHSVLGESRRFFQDLVNLRNMVFWELSDFLSLCRDAVAEVILARLVRQHDLMYGLAVVVWTADSTYLLLGLIEY